MRYSVKIKGSAQRDLARMERAARSAAVHAIDCLALEPHQGTLLEGQLRGLRRLRVGVYRVLFEVRDREPIVLGIRVGHRRDVSR